VVGCPGRRSAFGGKRFPPRKENRLEWGSSDQSITVNGSRRRKDASPERGSLTRQNENAGGISAGRPCWGDWGLGGTQPGKRDLKNGNQSQIRRLTTVTMGRVVGKRAREDGGEKIRGGQSSSSTPRKKGSCRRERYYREGSE